MDNMAHVVIGVDLGGTNVKTALVTENRQLIAKDSRPTRAEEGPEAVMDVMAEAARDLLSRTGLGASDVLAAGFGAPGPMNWQTGVVYSPPNLPGWKDVPLADEMQRRLGVPCFVDNDANVAC
ncbi:MAG TPA: ROK family protein, partial [Candidatus Hydrogenedentes bacterium]|nr:ROK family protein [Candidatus Hydrogenedentota bacterium]